MFGKRKKQTKENSLKNDFKREDKAADQPSLPDRGEMKDIVLLKTDKSRKTLGFFLLVTGIFMLISCISFLSTWNADQSIIESGSWGIFKLNNPESIQNAMGHLGAWVGYQMVHKGFGVASLLWVMLPIAWGAFLVFSFKPISFSTIFIHLFFVSLWTSILMAFFFGKWFSMLGGAVGYVGFAWIKGMVGNIGVVLFLGLYALIYLMYGLNAFLFKKPRRESIEPVSVNAKSQPVVNLKEDLNVKENEAFIEEPKVIDFGDEIFLKINDDEIDEKPAPFDSSLELDINFNQEPEPGPEEVLQIEPASLIEEEENQALDIKEQRKEHYTIDTAFDPTLELSNYKFPTIELLNEYEEKRREIDTAELEASKNLIIETLKNYNIGISKIKATIGPTVTLYEIIPAPGVKISKIKNLEDDIALSLAALGIRIIAPIPGKGTVGIEVPNKHPEMVNIRSVINSKKFQECDYELPVILGKTISNELFITDLAKMPHLLMAGATGQGKSVGLNCLLVSLLYKKHPAYVKFVLVDPKKVELTLFNKIERHFLAKLPGEAEAIITDNTKVINTLNSLCVEMDNRYKLLQNAQVRNIVEYNKKFLERKLNPEDNHRFLPYIVVVVDEVADLMMTAGKEIEGPIARIAQLARAIGIHLILATQRPSVDVITGKIKANFPARIAFRVTSKIDSRTILDSNGADQLVGRGDMLLSLGSDMIRLQCPFVDTSEIEKITTFVGEQRAYSSAYILPEVKEDGVGGNENFDPTDRDSLFEDAARIVVQNQVGSTSLIQRRLKIGYNRAGRLIDQLEASGIVGQFEGSKARAVLIPDEYALEQFLKTIYDEK